MHGIKASLIFIGFVLVAGLFLNALTREWLAIRRLARGAFVRLLGMTVFILLWFLMISSLYVRKALFLDELSNLKPSDVYSIRIGRHDFRDPATIEDVTSALRKSRWFEVNHGGWADSIPLTVRRHSAQDLVIDVALYFREPAAIVGPVHLHGLGYSPTQVFVPDLPRALARHGVQLPNCDTAHHRPCTAEQLNP